MHFKTLKWTQCICFAEFSPFIQKSGRESLGHLVETVTWRRHSSFIYRNSPTKKGPALALTPHLISCVTHTHQITPVSEQQHYSLFTRGGGGGEGNFPRRKAGENQPTMSEPALFSQLQGVPIIQALVTIQSMAQWTLPSLNLCFQKLFRASKNLILLKIISIYTNTNNTRESWLEITPSLYGPALLTMYFHLEQKLKSHL